MAEVMSIESGGEPIRCSSLSVKESIFMYCPVVVAQCGVPIQGKCTLKGATGDVDIIPVGWSQVTEALISTTFWPESFQDKLKTIYPPVAGTYDIKSLLEKYGFTYLLYTDLKPKWIEVPSMKYKTLMDFLTLKVSSGGGAYITTTLSGEVAVYDLYKAYQDSPKTSIFGAMVSSQSSAEWFINSHGKYKITQHKDGEKYTNTQEIEKRFGMGNIEEIMTQDKLAWQTEIETQNYYNRMLYTSTLTKWALKGGTQYTLGTCAYISGSDKDATKGVIVEAEANFGEAYITLAMPVV